MNKGSAEALRKSYLVGLTPAMRTALLDETATLNTARALQRRGMVLSWDLSNRDGYHPLNLTDVGKRAAEAIRAEVDATPIIPAERVAEIEQEQAEPNRETITVSVPKHLADAVMAAWSAAYDPNTPYRQSREEGRFETLAEAYRALRGHLNSYRHPWLSRALLDAATDADRLHEEI